MARIRPQLDPPLRARLQFADNSPTGARIVEDKALMARTFTYLFAGGATLALLTLLLPGSPDRSPLEFVGVGAAAYLAAALMLLGYDRLPQPVFRAMPLLGSLLVAGALLFGGASAAGAYAVFYLWVALAAFYFFDLPWAALCGGVASLSYAAVLLLRPEIQFGLLKWVMITGALFVSGVIMGRLRSRTEHLVARLADAARTDVLTGLANRGEFDGKLRQEVARATRIGLEFGLITLDIDCFGSINRRHGPHSGDIVLERVGQVLRGEIREADTLARLRDDKFAVLAPEAGQAGTYLLAERLRKSVRERFPSEHQGIALSAGVAIFSKHGGTAEEITSAAEQALLAAKRLGRDRTVIFSEEVASNLIDLGFPVTSAQDLPSSLESVLSLAELVDVNQMGSARHSQVVGRYAEAMAEQLGMKPDSVQRLRIAGILHDIGKIGVRGSILAKPGPLTEDEWAEMRTHPEIGARIARNAGLPDVAMWIGAHHERPDGGGYPLGLKEDEIPVQAKILAVADAYEAMINDRAYSLAMDEAEARDELRRNAGFQFDILVVDAFLSLLDEGAFAVPSGANGNQADESSVDASSTK